MQLPLVLLGASAAAPPPPAPSAIFRNGDDGFGSYRIPALLVVRGAGPAGAETVLAFGEGFPTGAASDHIRHIVMRRSTDSGRTFGPIAPNITSSSSDKGARWGGEWTSWSRNGPEVPFLDVRRAPSQSTCPLFV